MRRVPSSFRMKLGETLLVAGLCIGLASRDTHAQASPTVREMARVLAPCSSELLSAVWTTIQRADVRQGQYDWIELRRWYAILLKVESDGLRSLDIDEGVNRLSYTFTTAPALESFRSRAEALGVPLAALVLKVEPPSPPR